MRPRSQSDGEQLDLFRAHFDQILNPAHPLIVLDEHQLSHRRIKPHCPEENGLIERAQRTIGEALEEEALENYHQAVEVVAKVIVWYNQERLHSALGFLRPVDHYRGDPAAQHAARRLKLAKARHQRKEKNLQFRQLTLPLEHTETVP